MKNHTHFSIKPGVPAKGLLAPVAIIGAVIGAVIAAAVYSGIWFFLAGQIRDGIDRWAAERRAEGYGVEYAPIAVFGFPFRLEAVIVDPVLTAPGEHGFRSWRGPAMTMQTRPWALSKVRVLAFGRHRVTVITDGKRKIIDIEARTLMAELDFGPPGASFAATINATDIVYPREPVAGLGRTTKRLALTIEVKGDLPPEIDADALARWRDRGGTLDVSGLDIRHGPLDLTGDGTGALVADIQPIGAFTLGVRGFNEALDRLEGAGIIKPKTVALMKTVLSALARAQDAEPDIELDADRDIEVGPDSKLELKVPLSVQDGKLYIGPLVVAEVPVVRWLTSR